VVLDAEGAEALSGDVALAAVLEENGRLRAENAELRVSLAEVLARDAERDAELERLRADLAVLQRLVFGRSSEKSRPGPPPGDGDAADESARDGKRGSGAGRKRGPGARAGRRDYSHLPRFEVFWDFPGGGYCCPECGEPFTPLGDHWSGEQLDWQVIVRVAAHCRRRYKRACSCRVPSTVMRIKDLYAAHDELMAAWQDDAAPGPREKEKAAARLDGAYAAWDTAITAIDETRKKQMAAPGLAEPAKKALATLDREWDGLIAHRDYPMAGLDNNAAERMIRGPVITRKNARGSHNGDSAQNAAVIWTVTATAQMAGLNILTYLTAYLDECGRNGGKPLTRPTLQRFLPWNASPEDLRIWAQPPPTG
jgi:hypothetical protein